MSVGSIRCVVVNVTDLAVGEEFWSEVTGLPVIGSNYVYELEGDTLTIWAGEKGSPAYFKGEFNPDGDTVTGAWVYPGGGGYDSTMTRVG